MAPAIRHRLMKTDNIQPLPKRATKKSSKKQDDFNPKPNNKRVMIKKLNELKPAAVVAFIALVFARICAAVFSNIADCDETYNYWEPLHYLIYGHGLQTWEYSPKFALRSYTYLLFYGVPAWLCNNLFHPNPMLVFYIIRCLLGLTCAVVEMYFYKATCREFGVQIGRLWLMFQLFSAGMFTSGTSLLPSTFSMYFGCGALAAWWHQCYSLAIFLTAISTILGWPFAAILALPLCYDVLVIQRKLKLFTFWAAVSGITVLCPVIAIDSTYFGKFSIAPLNIILYNVFTSHGPNLYGTEPWTFYFINGFLNYNLVWIFALAAPFLLTICYFVVPAKAKPTLYLPYYISLAPMFLWLAVFIFQPHKEERFLYPIYPLIALCGAIAVDSFQKLIYRLKSTFRSHPNGSHYLDHTMWLANVIIVLSSLLGASRIASLYFNYHAPMDLMMELNTFQLENPAAPTAIYNVCVGKDWYRFPGSFFLPSSKFRIRFLKSEFNGMLPAYFDESANGTTVVHEYFNDLNQENEAMYFDYEKCHFLLDLDAGEATELEPKYVKNTKDWMIYKAIPFLDAANSQAIYRAFYIPYISNRFVKYAQFYLLKRKKIKFS